MLTVEQLNSYFDYLTGNIKEILPDGIVDITIKTLHSLDLLSDEPSVEEIPQSYLLQAVESEGKITLYNDRFVLWIVPQIGAMPSSTVIYVATHSSEGVKAELAFRTSGVHNKSKTILRLIDKFLADIQDTDLVISEIEKMAL